MPTVSSTSSAFNVPTIDLAAFAEKVLAGPAHLASAMRPCGHADELSAAGVAVAESESDELTDQELVDGLAEWDLDQAIQLADEHHFGQLRAAVREAKERFGATAGFRFGRDATIDSDTGMSIGYTCIVLPRGGDPMIGAGPSPLAALDVVTAQVDRRIVAEKIGYRVPSTGHVLCGDAFDRSAEDALTLARRIAIDPTYLDVLIEFGCPGIIELRDDEPAANAA